MDPKTREARLFYANVVKKASPNIIKRATELASTEGYLTFLSTLRRVYDQQVGKEAAGSDADSNSIVSGRADQVKENNPMPFRFLDLPAELRNEIYRIALCLAPMITVYIEGSSFSGRKPYRIQGLSRRNPREYSLSLLVANRQIYQEAKPIMWAFHHFDLHRFSDLRKFLQIVGPQNRTLIRKLSFWWTEEPESYGQLKRALRFLSECVDLHSLRITYFPGTGWRAPRDVQKLQLADVQGCLAKLDRLKCLTIRTTSFQLAQPKYLQLQSMIRQMVAPSVEIKVELI